MPFKRFQIRILVAILLPLALSQASVYFFAERGIEKLASESIFSSFKAANSLFLSKLSEKNETLKDYGQLLAGDFAFKQAFSTRDPATINSALGNHQDRIQADTMFLTDEDGKILAAPQGELAAEFVPSLLKEAGDEPIARLVIAGGGLVSLVAVPLRAPETVAWIFAGYVVNESYARLLKDASNVDASFFGRNKNTPFLLASTLEGSSNKIKEALKENLSEKTGVLKIDEEEFLTESFSMPTLAGQDLTVILSKSLTKALRPWDDLKNSAVIVFFVLSILSAGLAYLLAISIAKPILSLNTAAIQVAKGVLDQQIEIPSNDEIGELASSFNVMTASLAEESRQKAQAYEALAAKVQELTVLYDLSKATNFTTDTSLIINVVVSKISEFVHSNSTVAFLARSDLSGFYPVMKRYLDLSGNPKVFFESDLCVEGAHRDVDNLSEWVAKKTFKVDGSFSLRETIGEKDYICLCLGMKEKLLGLIFLENNAGINKEQLKFLETIAAQVAVIAQSGHLYKESISDGLTGMFNKRFFHQQLQSEIHRASRAKQDFSLIIFDIDHFKKVNDKYGHQVGDLVLRSVSAAVLKKIRKSDSAFRVGGEEFALILPNTNKIGATELAENLRKMISELSILTESGVLNISSSFGVAEFNSEESGRNEHKDSDAATLFRNADEALYEAKKNGRNQVKVS